MTTTDLIKALEQMRIRAYSKDFSAIEVLSVSLENGTLEELLVVHLAEMVQIGLLDSQKEDCFLPGG